MGTMANRYIEMPREGGYEKSASERLAEYGWKRARPRARGRKTIFPVPF